LEFLR
jgi:hypothetical protein